MNLNPTPIRTTESPLLGSASSVIAEESDSYSGSGEPLEYSIGGTTDTAPTTFSVTNGSSFVDWTAEVLIPQPNDTLTSDIEVFYPMTEWGPTKVIDPLGRERTQGTDWDFGAGKLTIYSSSVDVYGEWLVKFNSLNYMENLQLGVSGQSLSDSAVLNVGDDLKLRATSPWIENAKVGLELKNPAGDVWYNETNTTGTPSTEWHVPSFGHRTPLNISASNVDANLTDFPLLVDITDNDLKNTDKVQADGDDIVFVQNGQVLSHELVRFAQSTGNLTAWVKTNLSSSVDNTVYMYYGNPVVGPTENTTAVWTNGYEAAWHLDETYSDEADGNVHYDSTTGGYDGVQHGNYFDTGISYYAQVFDGTDDWISVNATEGLEPEGDVTVSGWFYLDSAFSSSSTTTQIIMSKYLDADHDMVVALAGTDYSGGDVPAGSLVWKVESYTNSPMYKWTTTTSWTSGWYHYSAHLDADTMSNNKIYIDGTDVTNSNSSGGGTTGNLSFSADWGIGGGTYEPPNDTSAYLNGSIDEVRVATGLRSSAWIAAEYDNQQPSSTFVTKGSHTQRDSPEHTFTKTIDSTAPAGKWTARTYYNDTGTSVTNKTGLYERNFIVKHDTSLILKSPGDAVGDQLTTKIAGEMLYVIVDLQDSDNTSDYVEGATVTMNWTVDGAPTQKTLVDHGNGTYSRTLNTTDLATVGRWRINIDSYHPYYNDASYYFNLDLSHETEILYETPPSTPYGDDFTVRITVRDAFNNNPVTGATITSNGTLLSASDNGDGTYDVALNSSGLSTGNYVYHINASPSETYLLDSTVDITFTLRDIYTATYGIGGNSVSTPYDIDTSFTVTYNDTDHSYDGISGASSSVNSPSGVTVVVNDNADGSYGLAIDVSGKDIGTYNIEVTFSKMKYEDSTFVLELTITQHDTFIVVDLDQEIPWGENSTFSITWYDSDTGGTDISSSVLPSDITVDDVSYGSNMTFSFDCDSWSVGTYHLNVTLYSSDDKYDGAWTTITLEIRAHHTSVTVDSSPVTPWGYDTNIEVVFWDEDTNSSVPITNVTTDGIQFDYETYGSEFFRTYSPTLSTSSWTVDAYSVNLSVLCVEDNRYYDSASKSFEITIRAHHTTVTAVVDDATPWGFNTSVMVTFWDSDNNEQVPVENVSSIDFNPTGYNSQSKTSYSSILTTDLWDVDKILTTVTVQCTGGNLYYQSASGSFNITIRTHYTTLTAVATETSPWGYDTDVIVTFWDTDTDSEVPIDNVTSMEYTSSSYGTQSPPKSYTPTLNTSTWEVGTETISIDVQCADSNTYYESQSTTFDIIIRAHHTFIEVNYDETVPWGETSTFVVSWYDSDDGGSEIDATFLGQVTVGVDSFGSLSFEYDTSSLSVGNYQRDVDLSSNDVKYNDAHTVVNITIRAHFTYIQVTHDAEVPWGETSSFVVTWYDSDTGGTTIDVSNLDQITVGSDSFSSFSFEYDTSSLDPGSYQRDVDLSSSSPRYYGSSTTVSISVRAHFTSVTLNYDSELPWGYQSSFEVSWHDLDAGNSEIDVTSLDNITIGTQSFVGFSFTYDTSSWGLGEFQKTLSVYSSDSKYNNTSILVNFTIVSHQTSIVVNAETNIPWGENSSFSISWYDQDAGDASITGNLDNVTVGSQSFGSKSFDLITDSWDVGTYRLDVYLYSSTSSYMHAQTQVNVTVRAHHTSVSVTGGLTVPYGNNTPVTVIFWDNDLNVQVPLSNVSSDGVVFDEGTYGTEQFSNYSMKLTTSAWDVGSHTIDLSITCVDSNRYYNAASHTFEITIRRLGIRVAHEPTDLIIPSGDDFNIKLRVNVSEIGNQYDGDPVSGLTSTEVRVENSSTVFSISWSELSSGRYNLTISNSQLTDDKYRIKITIKKSGEIYGRDYIVIEFSYRDARSYLSSPNYPQVTTPFETDVEIRLNYTDVDRNKGITTGTISAEGIGIYGQNHLGDGEYVVTLDVTGLSKGDHQFNITLDASQYEAKTLEFTLTVRIAYTYAIPTVGALDIPVGNDPVFYVDYWDTDHDVPVDNSSTPDTRLSTTWNHTVGVTYLSGEQRYKVTFITEDDDDLIQNYVVTFNFSKGENYQFGIFNLTVTIRTHNTDFRLVSAVDPTSSTGVFDISVYYGDLDNNIGIKSSYVQFRVENETDELTSDWENNTDLGDGFYIIHVDASQFTTLGIKTFNVYVNWTGTVYKYQNKTFTTSGNLVGEESSLTLLESAEPTPYLGNMSHKLFFSDVNSGNGIINDTGDVHIYVDFQGDSVDISKIDIWEVDQDNQPGNYSIRFNTTIFSATGKIYMNLNVNWSKGVDPFYTNRTDVISLRVLPRDTLVSLTPPSPTSYGENGTFSFTFEDVTGAKANPILDDPKLSLSMNVSFSFTHSEGTFTIEFNTTEFGGLGTKVMELNVTWSGSPFYSNRTNRIVFIDVIERQTVLEYLAPAPTQYLDNVTFTVTWTDVTGTSSEGIENATVSIYNGSAPIGSSYYTVYEVGTGQYEIQFNTTFYDEPAQYNLNVTLYSSKFYYFNSTAIRQFKVLKRVTLLSSQPISKVPYNSSITVILNYQDLYTLETIGNDSDLTTLEILNGTDWYFTSEWKPAFGYYVVEIQTYNHPELNISDPTSLQLRMSYETTSPYYQLDTLFIEFELRIRSSSLSIDDPAETTPYNDNATFTVFYQDEDAQEGIANGEIYVFNGSQLLSESTDYTLSLGSAGFYEISLNTSALGAPSTYTVYVDANWTLGSPYHDNATVSIGIRVRQRDTNVEITVPPSQTKFLDNVTFSFVYTDLDAGQPITAITVDDVNIYLQTGTEITSGFSLTQDGETFEISIPSDLITSELASNYELNVTVDWDESQSPYYSDDQTIVKVTITNRIMSISLVPISTTPLRDNMTVNFTLSDDDTEDPISGVIVDFDCQDPPISEYTLTQGTGSDEGFYSISFNTTQLNATGTYSFDLIVKWDPSQQPYYANLSTITLRGAVDLIYTSLQNDPPNPSSVQYTDSVSVIVYFEDLDHDQIGVEDAIMHVHYLETSIVPSNLLVDDLGGGQYNITFDTSNLAGTGPQTLNITAESWPYASRTVTPSFTVTVISTTLAPHEETIQLFWKESANVEVDYNNLLDGNLIPGATVTYSWDGGSGVFEDSDADGIYAGSVDTELANAGTRVITVTAKKDKFATSITTLTLVVKTLPSEIISITPAELVQDIDRGSDVNITLYLNDTTYRSAIANSYVDEVYATFENSDYPLSYNGTPGYYTTTIPGFATILPIDFYTVRLTAKLLNYDPASYQFKVNLLQTRTELSLTGDTSEDMVAVYSEIVNFTVLLTAPDLGTTFSNATVSWYLADTGETGNFTNAGDGVYWVAFNTIADAPGFGIWGLSFKARPFANASEFSGSTASLSLTVKKITTQVDRPPSLEVYWGWKGNVSFTYLDLSFNDTIPEARAPYSLSEFRGNATHIGVGEYLVPVDTSMLVPDTYQLSLTFTKENYQEATAVIRITVLEVPTEIVPAAPEKNRVENESTNLMVPVGETVDITFFYNDTDNSDGYVGGLENAVNITGISHPSLLETIRFDLEELGNGYYRYSFDTTLSILYQDIEGGPKSSSQPYTLLVKLELGNRTTATIRVSVTIIDVPTEYSIVEFNRNLLYGDVGRIVIYYNDTWHNQPVTGANLTLSAESQLQLISAGEQGYEDDERPGYYIFEYTAESPLLQAPSASSTLKLKLEKENTEVQIIDEDVTVSPTQAAQTLNTAFTFGTPISLVIILLLIAYIKIWSVPKRLRQINGQIKSLEKGDIPSPVEEAKSRQYLVAELFNDTYKEVEVTRTPTQMPSEAVEVEVPELGELLMMLSILTNLTPEELEEFKGDIDKMKPSEKAAFIKEVIHQEAIRAAKREDKETDVIIEEVREKARKRLRGEEIPEEAEEAPEVREVEDVERLLLKEEEPESEGIPPEGLEEAPPSDRLSPFELEELRKDLESRGVPPHEIDNLMKQAERLPRDLVEDLLESLDENGV